MTVSLLREHEIGIDVRRCEAGRVEKALEIQVQAQGILTGNPQEVGYK